MKFSTKNTCSGNMCSVSFHG